MINISAIQDCPNLYFGDKNIMRSSSGDNVDLPKYVVPGAWVIIQVLYHIQET